MLLDLDFYVFLFFCVFNGEMTEMDKVLIFKLQVGNLNFG